MKIRIPEMYKKALKNIEHIDYVFVGGFVRDILMKRQPKDVDIAVTCPVEKVASLLRKKAYIINERFNTARFTVNNINIDVNTIDNDIYTDIMRRDFTVNAISADISGNVYDPSGGIGDIEKHLLRPVSDDIFTEDPLRMIRAYRIALSHEMSFARGLKPLIKKHAHSIYTVSPERISMEMLALLGTLNRAGVFRQMHETGLLNALFPALGNTEKFIHRKYKSNFLIGHLLNTVEAVDFIYNSKIPSAMKIYAEKHSAELYLAALLHDIEKPANMREHEKGLSFAGHDMHSAKTAKNILKNRMRMPNNITDSAGLLIAMHMRPHLLVEDSNVKRKGFYRLMKDAGTNFEGLILLSLADQYASQGIFDLRYLKLYNNVLSIAKSIETKKIKIVTGNDIMTALNIKQGPIIGKLLDLANDYAVSNKISDKAEILAFVQDLLNNGTL